MKVYPTALPPDRSGQDRQVGSSIRISSSGTNKTVKVGTRKKEVVALHHTACRIVGWVSLARCPPLPCSLLLKKLYKQQEEESIHTLNLPRTTPGTYSSSPHENSLCRRTNCAGEFLHTVFVLVCAWV